MYLVRVGSGSWGDVVTLAVAEGKCAVLDFLMGLDRSQDASVGKMMYMLTQRVPSLGPPKHNKEQSRHIEDKIFEFKADQLRVLYFYDKGRVVVCAHGFSKQSDKTPGKEIKRAKDLRKIYLAAKKCAEVHIVDMD